VDDFHWRKRFRGRPPVALQSDPAYVRIRPHLHFLGHRGPLHRSVAALPVAHDCHQSRRRCRRRTADKIAAGEVNFASRGSDALPPGLVADHIRDLALKARKQGTGRLDQTLLLRSLADRLRGSNGFGTFASDTLMKLGLLGTIIGFIIMLAPIAGLDAADRTLLKSSMGLMGDGMAVAMYTTLAGLVGSVLLKVQYYMLDAATAGVFSHAVRLTETHVVPALEHHDVG
jgi:MotA/TolQ/ExbB proton channel family